MKVATRPCRTAMVGHRERVRVAEVDLVLAAGHLVMGRLRAQLHLLQRRHDDAARLLSAVHRDEIEVAAGIERSEEHTSELQSPCNLVCRLLLEKKKTVTATS